MTLKVPPSQDPNADFDSLVLAFTHQMGYESDNTKKGVKTAIKDYEAVLKAEPPEWVFDIWPSIALSVLNLAIAKEKPLPNRLDFPAEESENASPGAKLDQQFRRLISVFPCAIVFLISKNRLFGGFSLGRKQLTQENVVADKY